MSDARNSDERKPLVLITGAAGLLGCAIREDLAADHEVVGLDLDSTAEGWPDERLLGCDLTDDGSVRNALHRVRDAHGDRIASVIHLAAHYDFSGEDSPLYDDLTVDGTRRMLRLLREEDFDVKQFVFSSSLLVMAPAQAGDVLDEDSPTQAEWPYPQSKLEAEAALREERGDIPCVVLRIAGCYDDTCHSIPIAQQIRRIHEKQFESLFFPGNAHHGQAFIHLDDVVRAVRLVVEHREKLDGLRTYLLAETDVMSYGELQDALGELIHDKEWPSLRMPAPAAKAGAWLKSKLGEDTFIQPWMVDMADAHYPVSIERIRKDVGFEPRHRLRKTLPRMVEALKKDPEGWYEEHDLPVAQAQKS